MRFWNLFREPRAKPCFRGDYVAFSPFDTYALRALIRRIDKPFKRIAEIGSWTGNGSTRVVIEEVRNGAGILYCIDHWQGTPNVERHRDLASNFDMFGTFRTNTAMIGDSEIVRPLVMSSRDAAAIVGNQVFDLVFIDGDHSYDETISDMDLWLPKVAATGILCGHDCEGRPKGMLDTHHLWASRNCDTVKGNREFPVIHPGVILAVEEKFGSLAHLWSEDVITIEDGTVGRSTIWDVSMRML